VILKIVLMFVYLTFINSLAWMMVIMSCLHEKEFQGQTNAVKQLMFLPMYGLSITILLNYDYVIQPLYI